MSPSLRAIALLLLPPLLGGCAASGGPLGGDTYLQLYVDGEIVYEYNVPWGGMPCARNAHYNNLETRPDSKAVYRCASTPAPAATLPYSFVSFAKRGHISGVGAPQATTMRFASSELCHRWLDELEEDGRKLVSANCDGDGPPPPSMPGETLAAR